MTKKKSFTEWPVDEDTFDALALIMAGHPSEPTQNEDGEVSIMRAVITEYLMNILGKMNWYPDTDEHVKEIRECALVQDAIHGEPEDRLP